MNENPDSKTLQPGLNAEVELTVSETETAAHLGSGLLAVFATPALVALMENAAVHALEGHLQPGHTTVGGHIDIRHLAATPVGVKVRAHAELVDVHDRKLTFYIQAWDEVELIGEADHVRLLIEESSFMSNAVAKRSKA